MHHPLHLATALLTATAALTHAQVQSEAPTQFHTPNLSPHHGARADDISWIAQYTQPTPDGNENALAHDPRFKPFLKHNLTAPQTFWGKNKPLHEAALDFLGGPPGRVTLEGGRYFAADACVQHFCPSRGLLWIDTALPHPLVVFSAIDWISDNRATEDKSAAYTLWIFPSQAVDPAHIPAAFTHSINRWTAQPSSGSTDLQNITRVFLVDPDGTPHTLAPAAVHAHNALPDETANEVPITSTPSVTEKQP